MIFTGKNLRMIRTAVTLALGEVHNQIATCPDVNQYADDIAALEAERDKLEKLRDRMDAAIVKEDSHVSLR